MSSKVRQKEALDNVRRPWTVDPPTLFHPNQKIGHEDNNDKYVERGDKKGAGEHLGGS